MKCQMEMRKQIVDTVDSSRISSSIKWANFRKTLCPPEMIIIAQYK